MINRSLKAFVQTYYLVRYSKGLIMFLLLLAIVILVTGIWLYETYENVPVSLNFSDRRSGRDRRQQLQLFHFNDRRSQHDRRR